MKKLFVLFLAVAILLLLAVPSSFSSSSSPVPVVVEFPATIGNLSESIPVKISIPNPQGFGYPRVPVEISISLAEFRKNKIIIFLLEERDLTDPKKLKNFLDNPIEKIVEFPLPINKVGIYHLVVDIKCVYGPKYSYGYWYSYTVNKNLQIISEKMHIVGRSDRYYYGYTFSQSQCYDFLQKGVSFRFKVQVLNTEGRLLYEEPTAVFGTFFDRIESSFVEEEKTRLAEEYGFLLDRFTGNLKVIFEISGTGDWRWLFSTQPLDWVEKNGFIVSTLDPHWYWNPWGEFQYEYRE